MGAKPFLIAAILAIAILACGCAEKQPEPKCSDYAIKLIPKNITLVRYLWNSDKDEYIWAYVGNDKTGLSGVYSLYWKDGTIFDTKTSCYMRGTAVGQNISQYYLAPCSGTTMVPLQYSKKIVDSTGIIKGTTKFSITPRLRPIEGTSGTVRLYKSDQKEYATMDFEMISVSFNSCVWVTEDGKVIDDSVNKT